LKEATRWLAAAATAGRNREGDGLGKLEREQLLGRLRETRLWVAAVRCGQRLPMVWRRRRRWLKEKWGTGCSSCEEREMVADGGLFVGWLQWSEGKEMVSGGEGEERDRVWKRRRKWGNGVEELGVDEWRK
jgi:hypothetical protein